ncbi:hypothetical protein CQA53_02870 [Helicobacter didelphidarum]|uniref:Lipid/polyisoprenoid-binding YceI-like domain-containing protein n=2 Tax=Helicobacter didelphidarum TaxID=2040648 RepID=A0A3D8IQB7_9HELI|nr:hypothetical protein CQA53_02870 [Helicobacter didelphidarum]
MTFFFSLVLLLAKEISSDDEYIIDTTHSSVQFGIKHLSVADTIGVFQDFEGQLFFRENKILKLRGSVQISSINTFNPARDEDLQNDEFFQEKVAILESFSFKNDILFTKLTMNGITKEVSFKTTIAGPLRNPSLSMTTKENTHPLIPTTPMQNILNNPLFTQDSNIDCGCYMSYGENVLGIVLEGKINRFDFHISPKTPKQLLGEFVDIKIIIEASK